jgi:hypothetical protein
LKNIRTPKDNKIEVLKVSWSMQHSHTLPSRTSRHTSQNLAKIVPSPALVG